MITLDDIARDESLVDAYIEQELRAMPGDYDMLRRKMWRIRAETGRIRDPIERMNQAIARMWREFAKLRQELGKL